MWEKELLSCVIAIFETQGPSGDSSRILLESLKVLGRLPAFGGKIKDAKPRVDLGIFQSQANFEPDYIYPEFLSGVFQVWPARPAYLTPNVRHDEIRTELFFLMRQLGIIELSLLGLFFWYDTCWD